MRAVRERFLPDAEALFEEARWPREIVRELGDLGVLGMHLDGYGCAGASAVSYGLACQELEAGDSGLRTFASVQGSLAMTAIHRSAPRTSAAPGCRAWPPGRPSPASRSPSPARQRPGRA